MPVKETLQVFVDILRREQDALVAGNIDALPPLIAEKTALAEQLNRISVGEAALYRDLVSEASALNEANGKLIALRLQDNQQALNVLLTAANTVATYGPDGQQSNSGVGSRILGKA